MSLLPQFYSKKHPKFVAANFVFLFPSFSFLLPFLPYFFMFLCFFTSQSLKTAHQVRCAAQIYTEIPSKMHRGRGQNFPILYLVVILSNWPENVQGATQLGATGERVSERTSENLLKNL